MSFVDYYHLLGVDRKASTEDIRKSYRKLARQFHPDLHPSNNEVIQKFQKINEAQAILVDTEKRRKYDLYGEFWKIAESIELTEKQSPEIDFSASVGRRGFFRKLWKG